MQTKRILMAGILCCGAVLSARDFETTTLGSELASRTDKFLAGTTAEARAQIAGFSDADLQKVANEFKKSHAKAEQRIFWLSEELYRRNAERVAAERIRYLYYAVLAALLILAGFSFMTWRQAGRISRSVAPSTPATKNYPPITESAIPSRKKPKKTKGRSRK